MRRVWVEIGRDQKATIRKYSAGRSEEPPPGTDVLPENVEVNRRRHRIWEHSVLFGRTLLLRARKMESTRRRLAVKRYGGTFVLRLWRRCV